MAKAAGALLEQSEESTALAVPSVDPFTQLVERLATNKDVDVVKLQALIDMQKDINRENAIAAFNSAFTKMQAEIPTVIERSRTDKASYAALEDIVETLRPVLSRHGFGLSHRTEFPSDKLMKIVGVLMHEQGHSRESEFLTEADNGPGRNAIQARGSANSYGRRYTTKDLLNIVTREQDDDGAASEKGKAPEPPKGYDEWLADYEATAFNGLPALEAAWKASKPQFRDYLTRYDPRKRAAIKTKAESVKGQS